MIGDIEHRLFDVLPVYTWVDLGHNIDATLGAKRPHLGRGHGEAAADAPRRTAQDEWWQARYQ